ncbi:MAG: Uma2 family endonuclease [Tannerella sp.]|jgi:Uma2 family endonuclease|nr:Uma2 family endonuclease [Tannerella sp.]
MKNDDDENTLMRVAEPIAEYIRTPRLYSYADIRTFTDDLHREIIDGIMHVFAAPLRIHSWLSFNIGVKIKNLVTRRKGKCEIYHAPFDVRLPKNGETADEDIYTVVQPDICVICDPNKLDDKGCIGAPDLIVEVLSPSTAKRDMNEKFSLYERSGVREYWVVFPGEKAVTVFLLQPDGKYDNGTTYQFEGKVPISIFNGFGIDLKEMFE